jgi:RNA polymerase sigma-70 factor (ECF subfamily)
VPDYADEIRLIEAAQKNPQAFEALYNLYHDRIFRFVWVKVRDMEISADITSDVFMKALVSLKSYTNQGFPFSAWLFRLATNETNAYFRKSGKEKHVAIHPETKGEWDTYLEAVESRQRLTEVLEGLSSDDFKLVEWRFFDGFAFREIAEMESSTETAVKMKVYRILDVLKTQLTPWLKS